MPRKDVYDKDEFKDSVHYVANDSSITHIHNDCVFQCVCAKNAQNSTCGECFKKVCINNSITCSQCSLDFHFDCTDIDKIKFIHHHSNWLCNSCFTKICLDELPFSEGQFIDLTCHLNRGLKICHINIQSLRYKTDHLQIFVHSNNIDILCVTETWLTPQIDVNEIVIDGYNICRKDRVGMIEHGGIVVYIKEGIDYNEDVKISIDNDVEAHFTEINLPCTKPILLGTVYRQPSSNAEYLTKIDLLLQNAVANYNEVITVGDFNLNIFKSNYSKKVKSLAKNSNFTQLITEATRITPESRSCLDLAFVTHPDMIIAHGVHHLGLSDHSLIFVVRKSKKIKCSPKIIKSRSYKNFNDADFINSLKTKDWDIVTRFSDVNSAWAAWFDMFNEVCNKHAPIREKKIRGYLPEWVTTDFLKLTKDKEFYYDKAHKTNDPLDWDKAKTLRNKVNNLSKTLKKNYYNTEIENNLNNSKKLWKTIRKVIPGKNKSSITNIKVHDKVTTNDKDTANVFNNYFTTIGSNLASKFNSHDEDDQVNNFCVSNSCKFNFYCISDDYVFDQIWNFSNNKSPGLDDIDVKLFKTAAPIVCKSLAYICNLSLATGVFPSDWKNAKVVPVFKAGCKSNVENYRPISVLSIVSKIIERAVHDQMYSYLSLNHFLNPSQSGFRSQYSTATTVIDVEDFILKNMDEGKVTGAIFLDLKKAFDTVNHSLLLNKLKKFGIRDIELNWFKSYLNNRMQSVKVGSTLSDLEPINIGIPQGSILGPLLFIIFVNDLPDSVICKTVMYADDTSLLISSSDPLCLQNSLNLNMCRIASWFQKNHLTLNISKTKLMLFGTPQNLSKYQNISLIYDGETIERVDNFKYLGIVFDSHMTWSHHIDLIASNVSKRCGVIRRVKYYLPNYILKKLADSLVMPHFDYCSHVWSNCSLTLTSKLQILLNNLARIILSADIRTNIDSMMSSLKWLKLDDRWNNHILVMLYKCLTGKAPDYLCSKFSFTNSTHDHDTRGTSSNSLVVPQFKNNSGKRLFQARAANLWNSSVDVDTRTNYISLSLSEFKSRALSKPTDH